MHHANTHTQTIHSCDNYTDYSIPSLQVLAAVCRHTEHFPVQTCCSCLLSVDHFSSRGPVESIHGSHQPHHHDWRPNNPCWSSRAPHSAALPKPSAGSHPLRCGGSLPQLSSTSLTTRRCPRRSTTHAPELVARVRFRPGRTRPITPRCSRTFPQHPPTSLTTRRCPRRLTYAPELSALRGPALPRGTPSIFSLPWSD
jgi:hypothetical protein